MLTPEALYHQILDLEGKHTLLDHVRVVKPLALDQLLGDGIDVPEPNVLYEALGLAWQTEIGADEWQQQCALLTLTYVLGFTLGQLVPTLPAVRS
jgi:hypothetical protein